MGSSLPHGLRLGKIGYLNVLPIYHPLETGQVSHPFTIVTGTPAYLNGLMAAGELDLSVVSSIEYARHPERYFVVPDLSISCRGPVGSVMLLSQRPFKTLAGETIHVTTQSHTSVALLKVLLSVFHDMDCTFEPARFGDLTARGKPPLAYLAIGDEALRLRRSDIYPYRLDLGEAWHAHTGLPFVFALWVVQRRAVQQWNGRLDAAMESLAAARRWGLEHMAAIRREAENAGLLRGEELEEYYRGLNYNLDQDRLQGLELFFRHCVAAGEIEAPPRLEMVSPLDRVA